MLQLACNRNNATQHFQVRLSQFYQQQTLDLSLHEGIETYKWQLLLRAMTEARLSHRLNVYSALTHNPRLMINSEDCQGMHTLNDTNTKHWFLCAFRVLCMTSQKGKREVGRLSWQIKDAWLMERSLRHYPLGLFLFKFKYCWTLTIPVFQVL